jgi:hypothetical protein
MPENKNGVRYRTQFCEDLIRFFNIPPFSVTEVVKKDGSISLVETPAQLPTFAAFAHKTGVSVSVLKMWEEDHADFKQAADRARDLQGDILLQNSLRGNYSASFAVFAAKNLLGWSDGKEKEMMTAPLKISWEDNHEEV